MNKIKGVTQLIQLGSDNEESYRIYTYVDSPNQETLQLIVNGGLNYTWWEKDNIAGTGNENFRKFHLWFEYE